MPFVMIDTTDPGVEPPGAAAYAGYTAGSWPSYLALRGRHPNVPVMSIAIGAGWDAESLDIENGDASPWSAVPWVRRQIMRGSPRPCLYAARADMETVVANLRQAGIPLSQVRLWCAHPDGVQHLCTAARCGFNLPEVDATQYVFNPGGVNIDLSWCKDNFFAGSEHPQPNPQPPEVKSVLTAITNHDGRIELFFVGTDGQVWHTFQTTPGGAWSGAQAGKATAGWTSLGSPGK